MTGIHTTRLSSGATLVAEPMPSVRSVSLSWLLPVGSATDPPAGDGHASLLSELVFRGAGGMSSREHSDALDRLGVQRSSQVQTYHLRLGFTLLGDRLEQALPLMVQMVRDPALPADALAPVRSLALQTLESLSDDPQELVMLRLRERHLPSPFNRHGYGQRDVLENATIEALREEWARRCRPGGAILAIAGAVDPRRHREQLEGLLDGWTGSAPEPEAFAAAERGRNHLNQTTSQVHIGMAYDAPPEPSADAPLERLAVGVLSGGTSARLFTEVRQKRSLCYSVGASYQGGRDRGLVALYAGTTPERARETLEVCTGEIHRLAEGVQQQELERTIIGATSSLVMQGESCGARAASIAADQFRLGRPRTLDERKAEIESIGREALDAYLERRVFGELTVFSIGPAPLDAMVGV